MNGIVCALLYSHGNGPFARCIDVISELSHENKHLSFIVVVPELDLTSAQRDYLLCDSHLPSNVKLYLCPCLKQVLLPLQRLGKQPFTSILFDLPQTIVNAQIAFDYCFESSLDCFDLSSGELLRIHPSDLDFFLVREIPLSTSIPAFDISYGPQSLIYRNFAQKFCSIDSTTYEQCMIVSSYYSLAEDSRSKLFISVPSSIFSLNLNTKRIYSPFTIKKNYSFIPPVISRSISSDPFILTQYPPISIKLLQSIYIYNSGTEINSNDLASKLSSPTYYGLSFFSNHLIPNFPVSLRIKPPSFINNIKPSFVITRAGWGMVWFCMFNLIPLVLTKPTSLDDPEIWCNYEILLSTGLAVSEDCLDSSEPILLELLSTVICNQWNTLKSLKLTFGELTPGRAIIKHDYFLSLI